MKRTITAVTTLKLEVEYTMTNSSGIVRPLKFSSTFKTASRAARWYATHLNDSYYSHMPYIPDNRIEKKAYRRLLPIFKKYLP